MASKMQSADVVAKKVARDKIGSSTVRAQSQPLLSETHMRPVCISTCVAALACDSRSPCKRFPNKFRTLWVVSSHCQLRLMWRCPPASLGRGPAAPKGGPPNTPVVKRVCKVSNVSAISHTARRSSRL